MKRAIFFTISFLVVMATSLLVPAQQTITITVTDGGDDEINVVNGGDVPRNIAPLLGFDDLYDAGCDGDGVSIVVMDTGINGNHPDLRHGFGSSSSMIMVNQSFVPLENYIDGDGHGTFIAGMLSGNGDSSSGSIVGMVPAADIWNVKVLDSGGEGTAEWIENALDWILGLEEKPDIISMSFGASSRLHDIEEKVYQLWEDGVIAVIAAGNEGPEYYTVDSPGVVLDAVTVGACTTDEYLLSFSSEGPTIGDDYYKPDLVAFGADIVSLGLASGYAQGSGTSFAAPFISAGIALLIDATDGVYSPDEIKAAVINSCHSIGYSYYMEGAGMPNFSRALEILEDVEWNGFAIFPGIVDFPVEARAGTSSTLPEYSIKITVINSRYDGDIAVAVEGAIKDFTTAGLERYEGGRDQFVVKIQVQESSLAVKSGSGEVVILNDDNVVLASIPLTVTIESSSFLFPLVIIGIVVAFLIGIFAFFAVAYRKGAKAMPYNQCEIDGICPSK